MKMPMGTAVSQPSILIHETHRLTTFYQKLGADAVASVVLKRLEDAEADNDNILGVIVGAGTNHSAEAVSITHPHAGH